MVGYNEKLVGGGGEWPVTTKNWWVEEGSGRLKRKAGGRSRGVAGYNEKLVGGVGEWPATTKKAGGRSRGVAGYNEKLLGSQRPANFQKNREIDWIKPSLSPICEIPRNRRVKLGSGRFFDFSRFS